MVMLPNSPMSHNVIKTPFLFLLEKEVQYEKINVDMVTINLKELELLWSGIYGDTSELKDNSGDISPPLCMLMDRWEHLFDSSDALLHCGKNLCERVQRWV